MARKVLSPEVLRFINRYVELCGEKPTAEQALLIKYFHEAGDFLPVDSSRDWFYCAWRKVDVIETQFPLASKDMIVWHLLRIDPVIDEVVNELLPEVA